MCRRESRERENRGEVWIVVYTESNRFWAERGRVEETPECMDDAEEVNACVIEGDTREISVRRAAMRTARSDVLRERGS